MKIKLFCFSLILATFVTGCGSSKNDTNSDNTEPITEKIVEDIESNQNVMSYENKIDTTSNDGEMIEVDPKFYDVKGNEVKLSDFKGKPTVINFWASWCVPCQYEFNDFQMMYEKYGNDVQFLMIDLVGVKDETEEMGKNYIKENKYTFPTYYDTNNEVFYSLFIKQIPTTLFVNGDGTILDRNIGLMDEQELDESINQLIINNK